MQYFENLSIPQSFKIVPYGTIPYGQIVVESYGDYGKSGVLCFLVSLYKTEEELKKNCSDLSSVWEKVFEIDLMEKNILDKFYKIIQNIVKDKKMFSLLQTANLIPY